MRWLPLLLVAACSQAPEAEDLVRVRVGLWAGDDPIPAQATLESGTPIEMLVEPETECHLYVVHRGPDGAVTVLYPKDGASSRVDTTVAVLQATLDGHTGKETIYLVASREPRPELERAIATPGETLLAAVQEVRKGFEQVTVAEAKPAPIGGRVRGSLDAPEYAFADVFCRTFNIDHR